MNKIGYWKIKGVSKFQEEINNLKIGQKLKLVVAPNDYNKFGIDIKTEEDIKIGEVDSAYSEAQLNFLLKGKKYEISVERIYPVPTLNIKGVIIKVEG